MKEKKIHDRIVCVIPKILRFALFDKYEFENYLVIREKKWPEASNCILIEKAGSIKMV